LSHVGWHDKVAEPDGIYRYQMGVLEISALRIKMLLLAKGWSQAGLARRIGIAQQSVQRWVCGISSPTAANLDKLSEVTGLPQYWFFLPLNEEKKDRAQDILKITPNQKELLQTFEAFPEEDQQQMLKDMKEKKEAMDRIVARWLAAQQKVNQAEYQHLQNEVHHEHSPFTDGF